MARFQTSPELTAQVSAMLEKLDRPTGETYEVSSRGSDESRQYTIWYAAGKPALKLWVEFSGHGEYDWELPGDDGSANLEPLWDIDGACLVDDIAQADMEARR